MSKYEVIRDFRDVKDNLHLYRTGDKYPYKGRYKRERVEELMSSNNKFGYPVIQLKEGDKQ